MTGSAIRPDHDQIRRAAEVLAAGGLVAFPTETVYGLGADAGNDEAVGQIFAVKGRPLGHPLIVHLGDAGGLDRWADVVPPTAHLLADAFWPGPLTLLVRRGRGVSDVVTGGRDTVGIRVPDHPVARELLAELTELNGAGAIAAPSANRFGRVSPTTAAHVRADLGDDVDVVLDGGPCLVGIESTIVDLTGSEPEVIRPGGVSFDRLAEVLGRPVGLWLGDREVAAPGTLDAHYAPRAHVEVATAADVVARADALVREGCRVGVLAPVALTGLSEEVVELEPGGDPDEFARVLYSRLRQADRLDLEVLIVVAPEPHGVGIAVGDRLRRSAARSGRPVT